MATVREIAKNTGVSTATVSRVLNNSPSVSADLRQRVLKAAQSQGYATGSAKAATNLAVLYAGEMWLSSGFDGAFLQGVSDGMAETDYGLQVLDVVRSRHAGESYRRFFRRMGIAGAILRAHSRTRNVCEEIAEEGLPNVVVGERIDHPKVSYIYSESRETSREAVEHLIGLGHRRIAISINVVPDFDHQDRLEGYRDALTEAGIPFDPKLVISAPAHRVGGTTLIKRINTMTDRPTALYVTDPMAALGAMHEAINTGIRVPQQISIIGFDDTEYRYFINPTYTAICQDTVGLGREAIGALLSRIDEPNEPPIRRSLRTWLEVHDSTGPAPQLEEASPMK